MFISDLSNCDKEPIHIPGKIQSHGFLMAIDRSLRIISCSENAGLFLSISPAVLLDKPVAVLDNFLQQKTQTELVGKLIRFGDNNSDQESVNHYPLQIKDRSYNLIVSPAGEFCLLEFEAEENPPAVGLSTLISKSLSNILANNTLSGLLEKATEEIRRIIGFDRVMVYRFHPDGHGEVVAENKKDSLQPFLGLHYPASDIPKQARELYKENLVRLIADVHTPPSGLLFSAAYCPSDLDLTHSTLRAVSPIHIQYLKNMGVTTSFSISLIHKGTLWGLIACHHYSTGYIHFKQREAAALIGKVLSSTLSFQQKEEDQQKKKHLQVAVETLAKQLSQNISIKEALFDKDITLMEAVNAAGAALVIDHRIYKCGMVPEDFFIRELTEWLGITMTDQVFHTDGLPALFSPALTQKKNCSGLLAVRLSKELSDYLIWFRPEVISSIEWAGNPEKPVEYHPDSQFQISPRKSFEKWSQTVLNTSLPWEAEDLQSALHLKEEVASSIIQKAAQTRQLNEKLQEAYDSLDTFSHTISHDLKNPLTTISAYSQMLKQTCTLEKDALRMVSGIISGTNKMESMIKNILHYSRLGQSELRPVRINMEGLLNALKQELLIANHNIHPEITLENTPDVWADETMALQVFTNLIANAIKYSSKSGQPRVVVNGINHGSEVEYIIADNGIGIRPSDMEKIFGLFARSQDVAEYEGSGVGLSIVQRIMKKHGGDIRAESHGEQGATFYVTFPNRLP